MCFYHLDIFKNLKASEPLVLGSHEIAFTPVLEIWTAEQTSTMGSSTGLRYTTGLPFQTVNEQHIFPKKG